jgi:hypothetical protein
MRLVITEPAEHDLDDIIPYISSPIRKHDNHTNPTEP